MATFHKTVEAYREGAHTLPAEYYTSPEMLAKTAHGWTYPYLLSLIQTRAPPGKLVI